jgi:hypothetical protein
MVGRRQADGSGLPTYTPTGIWKAFTADDYEAVNQLNCPPTAQRQQLKANCFHSILSQTSRKVPKWSIDNWQDTTWHKWVNPYNDTSPRVCFGDLSSIQLTEGTFLRYLFAFYGGCLGPGLFGCFWPSKTSDIWHDSNSENLFWLGEHKGNSILVLVSWVTHYINILSNML